MSTANGIVKFSDDWFRASVEAKLRPGRGRMLFAGAFPQSFIGPARAAINVCTQLDFIEDFDPSILGSRDLVISISSPGPVVGESLQLALCVAVIAELLRKRVPADSAYTGIVGPAGEVIPVDEIEAKRKAAKRLGYARLFLPSSQLDYFNSHIAQCPVANLEEAIAITFFGDEDV
jgi:ATP-dependent Lon protease